jgi:hypothetical protein
MTSMIAQWLYVLGLTVPPAIVVLGILMVLVPRSHTRETAAHGTHAPVLP